MSLKNKNIIVAGGSGLIGKAILKELLKNGANVINIDIVSSKITGVNEFVVNITNNEEVVHFINKISLEYKIIDGFINTSYPKGKTWGAFNFEELQYEVWDENVKLHLNTYFFLSQKILNVMKNNNDGYVVNFASIYGLVGNDFSLYEGTEMKPTGIYPAIKGGIINLTRFMAAYYSKYNIKINCLSPGGIFDNQNPDFVARYERRVPLGRMGTPEDIAPVASFLVSEGAKYITGQNIIVDGGWTCI